MNWSATAGVVDASGNYTVPTGLDYTAQTVTVTSVADSTQKASSRVSITPTGVLKVDGVYKDPSGYTIILLQNGTVIEGEYQRGANKYVANGSVSGYVLNFKLTLGASVYGPSAMTVSPDVSTISGNLSGWGAITWTRQVGAIALLISPNQATIRPGSSQQFIASITGISNPAVAWTILEANGGSISSTGLYTAPALPGAYTVKATSLADPTKSVSAAITVRPPVVLSSTAATIQPGAAQTFTATLTGFPVGTSPAWRVIEPGGGTVDATGKYTAPLEAGTYTLEAAASDPDGTRFNATATITVPFSLVVTPTTYTIGTSQQRAFIATLSGAGNTQVSWSVEPSSAGTISADGVFVAADVAPQPTGTPVLVRATSVARPDKSAVASVTLKQTVYVAPTTVVVEPDGAKAFTATVTGLASNQVDWSTTGGTIDSSGNYRPPALAGTYLVNATSRADSRHVGRAQVTVPVRLKVNPGGTVLVPVGVPVQLQGTVKGATDQRIRWTLNDSSCGRISNFDDIGGWQSTPDPASAGVGVLNLNGSAVNADSGGIFFGLKTGTYKLLGRAIADGSATDEVTLQIVDLIAVDPGEFTLEAGQTKEIHAWTVGYVGTNGAGIIRSSNDGSSSNCDAGFDPTYDWMTFTTTGGTIGPVPNVVGRYALEPGQPNLCDPSPTRKIGARRIYQAPEEHGIYYIEVTSANRPESKGVAKVTVPLIVRLKEGIPTGGWVRMGSTSTFKIEVSGSSQGFECQLYSSFASQGADPGTIASNGVYTAPSVLPAGSNSIQVNLVVRSKEDPSKSVSTWFWVSQPVTVSGPYGATYYSNRSFAMSARLVGLPSNRLLWSCGGGSITQDGVWTAPENEGDYRITATSLDDPTASDTLVAHVPFTLNVTPGYWAVTLPPAGSQRFVAEVHGVSDKSVTWTANLGSITPEGMYSAPNDIPGNTATAWITATSNGKPGQYLSVPLTISRDDFLTISKGFGDEVDPGYVGQFNALRKGAYTNAVTWSCTGGSITASGLYTAPDLAGSYTVTATCTDNTSLKATTPVQVKVIVKKATETNVVVGEGQSFRLRAEVKGAVDTSMTWLLASGVGTLDADGTYHAPATLPNGREAGATIVARSVADINATAIFYITVRHPVLLSPTALTLTAGTISKFTTTLTGLTWADLVWSASGGQIAQDGTYTAPVESGTYTVTAAYAADPAIKDTATVTVPLKVTVQPTPTVVFPESKRIFTAKVSGDPTQKVVWTCKRADGDAMKPAGTVDQYGVYTPPDMAGDYLVVATSRKDPAVSGSAQVLVPVEVSVTPALAVLKPGGTRQFSAAKVAGAANKTVTWTVLQPEGGTISASGLYTAPAAPGTYTVLATSVADPRFFSSAEVRVTADGEVEVSLTPEDAELKKGGSRTFVATVSGTDNTAVTWSCDAGTVDANGNYTAPATFGTFTVKATSVADPTVSATATIVVSPLQGGDRSYTYDENGNLLSDGTRTFEWDEENRLVSVTINATGHRSEFVYDGLGRRVQILEKDPDATQTLQTTSDKKYLWVGTTIAEERSGDDGGTVQKRFFAQGFMDSDGTILLYTRDHLGSVRELVDMQQNVRARYEYDPYGNVTKISGDRDSVFLYTGHFWHQQSGLYLTYFRAYDPNLGRWISRDPSGERSSTNLYAYVGSSPIGFMDPSGLSAWDVVNEPWFQSLANSGRSIGGFYKDLFTGNVQKNAAMRYAQGPLGQAEALTNPCSNNWLERNAYNVVAGSLIVSAAAALGAGGLMAAEMSAAAEETTMLYRAMSPAEFSNVAGTGEFFGQEGVSMGGKWFATTAENAATWGEKMFVDTGYRVLGVEVGKAGLAGAMFKESLDGIGAAWYVAEESLPALNAAIRGFFPF
ncbi:MAG: Ig-like domain-containing protein [Acidobacteria bacterium]|nr:Ig-like domain-containing protein [Acidobacteriota bacterium]MBI3490120.1 Ig-like domain-containing protein [Acidobacteriota bacterium]